MVRVVGLGPGDPSWLPARNWEALRSADKLLLRTAVHPMADELRSQGIAYSSCDDLYTSTDDFAKLYERIADRVIESGAVYAVPGHPMLGEESVRILASRTEIEVFAAPSFVDAVMAEVRRPLSGALQIWNAHEPEAILLDARSGQLIYQIDSQEAASSAKLHLLRWFPPEHSVVIVSQAGMSDCSKAAVPLSELDRQAYDPLTSAFCEGLQLERPQGFYGLVSVVDRLLAPGGCPWDREQTHDSLKKHMVEETYEVLEAIDSGDPDKLCEELGDFLLQALMHSQMDAIEGLYDIDDVISGITDKLVRRHPHVFGDVSAENADEVLANWDAIKKQEKPEPRSILDGVPRSLPALLRAHEVSKRASRAGFEWPSIADVFAKIREEEDELAEAIRSGDAARVSEELGDILFTLVNIARWLKVEPEDALRKMVDRFTLRFQAMEGNARKPLRELSLAEWDELWERSKLPSPADG